MRRASHISKTADRIVAGASPRNVHARNVRIVTGKAGGGSRRLTHRVFAGVDCHVVRTVPIRRIGELGHAIDLEIE